jgi:uncharacterized protein (DUF1330 family)
MAAYLISDITVRDRTAFEIYRTRAADAIQNYGGRYLARLGEVQVLEGSWNPNMIVVVEFPNLEQARAWYRSPEYAFALEVRDTALSRNLILVDGLNQPATSEYDNGFDFLEEVQPHESGHCSGRSLPGL